MKKLIIIERVARILSYCAVIAMCCTAIYASWPLRSAIEEARNTVRAGGEVAREIKPQIAPAAHSVGLILKSAAVTSDEIARASVAQRGYWMATARQSSDLIAESRSTVAKIGAVADTVNVQLPPTVERTNRVLDRLDGTLATANNQLTTIGPFVASATRLTDSANQTISNPELAASLANFRRISAAWAATSEDVQGYAHRALNPSRARRFQIALGSLRLAAPAISILHDLSTFGW